MKKTTLKKTLAAAKPTVATSVPATETGVAPTTNSTLATTPETTATATPISETATANANERMLIYQVLPRLYGNTKTINHHAGTIEENGCGKMNDFTEPVLKSIKDFGYTHIWYTGLLEHATQTSYADHGIAVDNPIVVKGKAGSPYAIKDYYDIDPDLAKM
ncbi:glycosidase [gut metagenome]|uniref:Glycosidase n=1 Tax=gut metagenome TaxID=749906 RepID=J9FYT6_9ZZZZ